MIFFVVTVIVVCHAPWEMLFDWSRIMCQNNNINWLYSVWEDSSHLLHQLCIAHKAEGLKETNLKKNSQKKTSCPLVPGIGEVQQTLNPTFPKVQPIAFVCETPALWLRHAPSLWHSLSHKSYDQHYFVSFCRFQVLRHWKSVPWSAAISSHEHVSMSFCAAEDYFHLWFWFPAQWL